MDAWASMIARCKSQHKNLFFDSNEGGVVVATTNWMASNKRVWCRRKVLVMMTRRKEERRWKPKAEDQQLISWMDRYPLLWCLSGLQTCGKSGSTIETVGEKAQIQRRFGSHSNRNFS
jgi:hypothetical protein